MDDVDEGHGLALGVMIGFAVLASALAIGTGLVMVFAARPEVGAVLLCGLGLIVWRRRGERRKPARMDVLAGGQQAADHQPSNDNLRWLAGQPRYAQLRSR